MVIAVLVLSLQLSFHYTATIQNSNRPMPPPDPQDLQRPLALDNTEQQQIYQQQRQHIKDADYEKTSTAKIKDYHGGNQSKEQQKQQHAIPKVLIFTHYKKLLDTSQHDSMNDEERALAENVQHSIDVHASQDRDLEVLFWTDEECVESIRRVYPSLVPYFLSETEGMFKGDICRGVALYEHGGFYLDVDVGVRHSLWDDLKSTTTFVTSLVHRQSRYPGHFFQAVLGVSSRHPVIYRYLRLFEKHYTGVKVVEKGPLGVILLKRAWDEMSKKDSAIVKQTELYQEILYNPDIFPTLRPAPVWGGKKRACHFLVAAKANHKQHVEFQLPTGGRGDGGGESSNGLGIHVPVLSRVPGSRMCPDIIMDDNGDTTQPTTKWWDR
jgi:mannosyltransferase OCH1-like enzyme